MMPGQRCAGSAASWSARHPSPRCRSDSGTILTAPSTAPRISSAFPGVWHHGDYAAITEHDGVVIYGRSDAVLNPGGVRIGTAEIYAAVESLPQVAEALAVGQEWQGDVRVVLFVRLQPGVELDEALKRTIRETIRTQTTARHVPARMIAVPDIPRTLSGKLTELAVRNVIHGLPVKNLDALANPAALEHFRDLPELKT